MTIVSDIDGDQLRLQEYALTVLPDNGCGHKHVWHDFISDHTHHVRCMDCGALHTAKTGKIELVYLAARYEWQDRMCVVAERLGDWD